MTDGRGPRTAARARAADGESDVLAKIAGMPEPNRAMAERLHTLIEASAPALSPRTWYQLRISSSDSSRRPGRRRTRRARRPT